MEKHRFLKCNLRETKIRTERLINVFKRAKETIHPEKFRTSFEYDNYFATVPLTMGDVDFLADILESNDSLIDTIKEQQIELNKRRPDLDPSSAEELFKKLGYKKTKEDEFGFTYTNKDLISHLCYTTIDFDNSDKTFSATYHNDYDEVSYADDISFDLLQAIYKQLKELRESGE